MNRHRVTIKIGSNVLTRDDGTLDVTRVSSIVDQVCQLRNHGIEVLLVSSGAVACGRSEMRHADIYRLDGVSQRQLYSAIGQVKLINRYYDLFGAHGIAVGQVLTMKENFKTRRHYLNQRNCMMVMLDNDVVPIINENDTVSVTELMFTDNDELSGMIASMMDCDTLLILSNIDGIYDGNPNQTDSKLIREVSTGTDLSEYIVTEKSGFGRGGMATKHRIARKIADEGIEVIIANGKREDIITSLILGDNNDVPCTRFVPAVQSESSVKRWIAHSEGFTKGRVIVNDQAARMLLSDRIASLLPIGIVAVEGEFWKNDLISVCDTDGNVIGIGKTAYNADEARSVIGKHGQRPLIHYDYLYVE